MLDEHEQIAVIDGLRRGSRDAWAKLYDAYSVDVWRYVARLLAADSAAVGDVVQEVFLEAARSAKHFDRNLGTLWTWLAGIAHHRVSNHWRQTNRRSRLQQLAESGTVNIRHLSDGELKATATNEARDTADFVRSVLIEISHEYAWMLAAKYLDERSIADIAAQCGSSIDAIKSKLARAREEFRSKFESLTKTADNPPVRRPAEK